MERRRVWSRRREGSEMGRLQKLHSKGIEDAGVEPGGEIAPCGDMWIPPMPFPAVLTLSFSIPLLALVQVLASALVGTGHFSVGAGGQPAWVGTLARGAKAC